MTCAPAPVGDVGRLARRSAGRNHVLDDQHAVRRRQREPAPEHETPVLPLGEERTDAERARRLLADDDAAERGREHGRRLQVARPLGDTGAERFGELGELEHQRALEIAIAVQPG